MRATHLSILLRATHWYPQGHSLGWLGSAPTLSGSTSKPRLISGAFSALYSVRWNPGQQSEYQPNSHSAPPWRSQPHHGPAALHLASAMVLPGVGLGFPLALLIQLIENSPWTLAARMPRQSNIASMRTEPRSAKHAFSPGVARLEPGVR
jgi:hypothetical protein